MKAMIFAAGLGTRLRPLTDHKPKALVEVHGKPLLAWVLLKIKAAGIEDCVVNVHHFAEQIEQYLVAQQNFGLRIQISDERTQLLETGGGLKFAQRLLEGKESILIHNADIISDLDFAAMQIAHEESGALASLAVSERKTSRYLQFDSMGNLCGWENIKTGEIRPARQAEGDIQRLAFSGVHMISPALLPRIVEEGKFSIIDVYLRLAQTHRLKAYVHDSQNWFDVGKPENLQKAATYLKHQTPQSS